ncbi:MAG: hypothetical protein R3274_02405 [Desulfobacterales bacterium]|nr:hypothetical protein [Desulfobacterales bacterium]
MKLEKRFVVRYALLMILPILLYVSIAFFSLHTPGDQGSHQIPEIMRNYRSGGTPWTVIIDPSAKVVFNHFHIDEVPAIALIERLRLQK